MQSMSFKICGASLRLSRLVYFIVRNNRNSLMTFLKPFAQQGKVVSEADVRGFFASLVDNPKKT